MSKALRRASRTTTPGSPARDNAGTRPPTARSRARSAARSPTASAWTTATRHTATTDASVLSCVRKDAGEQLRQQPRDEDQAEAPDREQSVVLRTLRDAAAARAKIGVDD